MFRKSGGGYGKGPCSVVAPFALILTMFYAVPRAAIDLYRDRRSQNKSCKGC